MGIHAHGAANGTKRRLANGTFRRAYLRENMARVRHGGVRRSRARGAPVCTPTFKLMLRDGDLAAVLAEDLPGGVTVTELVRRGVL